MNHHPGVYAYASWRGLSIDAAAQELRESPETDRNRVKWLRVGSFVEHMVAPELATLRAQLAEMRAELLREHEDHAQTVIDAADVLRELREVTAQRDEYKNALWKACGDNKEHVKSYLESQRSDK
jgi:hypothetical protein